MKEDWIWITWEHHRRSAVLASHFGCSLFQFIPRGPLRYPKSIVRTVRLLLRAKPRVLFVQNPSMILAFLAVLWGRATGTFVVVDRHTTFLLNRKYRLSPWLVTFKLLNRITLRYADVTIVTNNFLAELVSEYGGRPYVLQDKLPDLEAIDEDSYPVAEGVRTVLFSSSFAEDEPIREVLAGVDRVEDHPLHLYVTGRRERAPQDMILGAPPNVTFTGFLPDDEYLSLLQSVDVVLVLTTADHTMLCGCYEAVSAGKVLVTSDKNVLRDYFRGAIFVDNTAASIAEALDRPNYEMAESQERMDSLREDLRDSWSERAKGLGALIEGALMER